MHYSFAFAAVAVLAKAQVQSVYTASATVSSFSIETTIPDQPAEALDFDAIAAIPDPTYTEVLGLASQDIPYATASALSAAADAIIDSPLSVFPAATAVAMNADGDSDTTSSDSDASATSASSVIEKREIIKRTACAPQATISDTYGIDVSSYSNFKNDAKIASVANAAPTPAGYYQNSKNLLGAQSAYAYMGYIQVKTYDVQTCADKCTKKAGCLAFNIYFERDPIVEPGFNGQCENPTPFANIKCSFWGSILEDQTATNYGQWRSSFQVAVAGSNSYTSRTTGGPIDGCAAPDYLNNATMNAPLRDCQGTWTYMGFKLFTSASYDTALCKTACDTQSAYNRAHPPTNGDNLAICSAFGSYLLTKSNSSGIYPQGQMCTFYTSGWGKQYAVNYASYDDAPGGGKFTPSMSYFYNITAVQPKCPTGAECSKPYTCGGQSQQCSTTGAICFKDVSGAAFYAADTQCGKVCFNDSDCGSGSFCSTEDCCGFPNCAKLSICSNPLIASRLFKAKVRDLVVESMEKRDDAICVPSKLAACPSQA